MMGRYEVQGMTLITQAKTMSCWYASAQMLIKWRQDRAQQSLGWLDEKGTKIRYQLMYYNEPDAPRPPFQTR